MSPQFAYLADYPELVPVIIRWWHSVWSDRMGNDFASLEQQLIESLSITGYPTHVLAMQEGQPVAVAALKLHELEDLFPQNMYRLGSVFVAERWRGAKLGSQVTERIVQIARERKLPHLYLQTQNLTGGLYARLGWKPLQKLTVEGEETLLMIRNLGSEINLR